MVTSSKLTCYNKSYIYEPLKTECVDTVDCKEVKDKEAEQNSNDCKELHKTYNSNFCNILDLEAYLSSYKSFKNGTVFVSGLSLQKCINDELELSGLEGMLRYADQVLKRKEEGTGPQFFKMFIDGDGNVSTFSMKITINVNTARRMAQLAAARTSGDMKRVISILKSELAQVKAGERINACDKSVVNQVKRMLRSANIGLRKMQTKEKKEQIAKKRITGKMDKSNERETGSVFV